MMYCFVNNYNNINNYLFAITSKCMQRIAFVPELLEHEQCNLISISFTFLISIPFDYISPRKS